MQDLNRLFEDLKHTNQAGVYRLINNADKSVYINFSSNISRSLVNLLYSNLMIPEFEFKVLEIVTENSNLRPRCQFYKDQHSNMGYQLLNPKRVCSLKLHIEPIEDFRLGRGGKYLFMVKVVSQGFRESVVGIFNDYSSLDVFCAENYKNSNIYKIVTASNDLTLEYLKYASSK